MSRTFLALFFALVTVLGACTPPSGARGPSGTIRVRIPVVDESGVSALDIVTLEEIEDLNEMRGRYVEFTFAPRLTPQGLRGDRPRARFIRADEGVYVPADEATQHMAVIYYETQRMAKLDFIAGAGDWLSYPRAVGIGTRLRVEDEIVRNNAFYESDLDAMLVVPYNAGSVPLAINPGVLAHEHFHALFARAVLRPLLGEGRIERKMRGTSHVELGKLYGSAQETPARESAAGASTEADRMFYDAVLLKAVNEGLADVWAWIHTGDTDFLQHSLAEFKNERTLRSEKGSVARPQTRAEFVSEVNGFRASDMNRYAYIPGTILARALVASVAKDGEKISTGDRRALARRMIKALPLIAREIGAGKEPGPSRILEILRGEAVP